MARIPSNRPVNPASDLEGVTYAVVLATILIVLSPYSVGLFNVLTVAAILFGALYGDSSQQ